MARSAAGDESASRIGASAAPCSAVSGGAIALRAPTARVTGRAPLLSLLQHEQVTVGETAQAPVAGARRGRRQGSLGGEALQRGALAIGQASGRGVPFTAARPASVSSATSTSRVRTRGLTARPAPGGSTSCMARAVVEQYSSASQRASATRSGGIAGSTRARGLGEPLRRELRGLGALHDDAEHLATSERDREQRPDARVRERLRQAVVERPAHRARGRERLDAGDRRHVRSP